MENRDHVDEIIAQWQRERPDVDITAVGIIGRVSRLSRHLESRLKPIFDKHGIHSGEYDVLASLRRSGEPYQLTPTELFKALMLSSGAMTNRLNRLEEAGLISRDADPNDRRGTLVSLTPKGLELMNRAVEDHAQNEQQLVSTYTPEEQKLLMDLLRKLLLEFENEDD